MKPNTVGNWFRSFLPATKLDLIKMENRIMATQQEQTVKLNEATERLKKVQTETRTLLDKIKELTDALANQSNVTPELQAAVDAITTQVQVVDELVPDAP